MPLKHRIGVALLARVWIHVLRRYLKDQDAEKLHLRIVQGRLHLFNMQFRAEAFDHIGRGFRLKHGSLGQLMLTLDHKNLLGDKPLYITMEACHLTFVPREDEEMTPEWLRRHKAEWLAKEVAMGLQQMVFGSRKLIQYMEDNVSSRMLTRLLQNMQARPAASPRRPSGAGSADVVAAGEGALRRRAAPRDPQAPPNGPEAGCGTGSPRSPSTCRFRPRCMLILRAINRVKMPEEHQSTVTATP